MYIYACVNYTRDTQRVRKFEERRGFVEQRRKKERCSLVRVVRLFFSLSHSFLLAGVCLVFTSLTRIF